MSEQQHEPRQCPTCGQWLKAMLIVPSVYLLAELGIPGIPESPQDQVRYQMALDRDPPPPIRLYICDVCKQYTYLEEDTLKLHAFFAKRDKKDPLP